MPKLMPIEEIASNVGKSVKVRGWIHRKRDSGAILFIVIRDRTGTIQASVKKALLKQKEWDDAAAAAIESSILLSGTVKKEPRAPTGYELEADSVKIISGSEPFPITEYQSAELLLDNRHLWLRSQRMRDIMKARAYVFRYLRKFLDSKGFYEITPPLLTKAGGETGADLFEVDYFGQKAYLTESSQFYSEVMAFSLEKVYSFAPSYRAEKSRTIKHLAEYWHLEPEMAYYNNDMNMKLQERLVSNTAIMLAKNNEDILKSFNVDPQALLKIKPPFKRITYEKALEVLNEKGADKKWGDDLGVEDERLLTEDEEKPVFVTLWPREIKPFYMPVNPKDERTVMCADLQAPKGQGEIIGGSERIWRMEELKERIAEVEKQKQIKIALENYQWWLDLRRYGSVPHAGFGLGVERVIKWLLNLDHIRDAIPFPRTINRAYP
jgi:asparaginyl-tRNA synthetase